MRITPVVGPTKKNRFFADFAKIPPRKNYFPAVFSAWADDQSRERINLPRVTLFDFCPISCRSGGNVGVPPGQLHSVSSVVLHVEVSKFLLRSELARLATSRGSLATGTYLHVCICALSRLLTWLIPSWTRSAATYIDCRSIYKSSALMTPTRGRRELSTINISFITCLT